MAITYTWEVTGLKVKDVSDTKPSAVVQTYWKKIGTDENGNTGYFSGATPFTVDPTDDSGPFIAFEDLTEQDVIDWIKSVVTGGYEEHVNEKIQEQIDQIVNPISEPQLPWKPVEEQPVDPDDPTVP